MILVAVAFALCSISAAFSARLVDPMVTVIARDLALPVTTAALLSTAYAVPFALGQPLLGPIGDSWGKARLLKACLWVLAGCLTLCALAPTFELLVAMRFCAGVAAGGVIPSTMAMIGDRFSGNERQIVVGRIVSVALLGQVVSASLAGITADHLGWRVPLGFAALLALSAAIMATRYIAEPNGHRQATPGVASALAGYRQVFSNPKAYLCYGTVFLEGLAFFGAAPYIVDVLEQQGNGGPTEAGLVLGAFGVGGFLLALSVPWLLMRLSRLAMMAVGGVLAGVGLAALALALPWPLIALGFVASGVGFMMLHNSIQTETLDLAPAARSSSYAAHAFFFFTGQALGPVMFGAVLDGAGPSVALGLSICILAITGAVVAMLFRRLIAIAAEQPSRIV